jgi:cell wall-associated NlpC family hydrolase
MRLERPAGRHRLVGVDHAVHVRCVMRRVMAASAAALAIALTVLLGPARPASAATASVRIAWAAHWAATQAGKPYVYGGIGPWGYDCSGLVYTAYRRYGFALPRTTYSMLGSWHLYRVYHPVRGDLAFYGSGHVEILTGTWGVTFGMLHSGTVAGYHRWNAYWHPTAFYRVR